AQGGLAMIYGPGKQWEEWLKATPGLKGRSMLVLLVLLDIAAGQCRADPTDGDLAQKCRVSEATIYRGLQDLAQLGVICLIWARGRRQVVFLSHPETPQFLASVGGTRLRLTAVSRRAK